MSKPDSRAIRRFCAAIYMYTVVETAFSDTRNGQTLAPGLPPV